MVDTTVMAALSLASPLSTLHPSKFRASSPLFSLHPSTFARRLLILSKNTFSNPCHVNSSFNYPFHSIAAFRMSADDSFSKSSSPACSTSNSNDSYSSTLEEDDDDDDVVGAVLDKHDYDPYPSPLPDRWDVLGLGQAMADFSGVVDDDFLKILGLDKAKLFVQMSMQ